MSDKPDDDDDFNKKPFDFNDKEALDRIVDGAMEIVNRRMGRLADLADAFLREKDGEEGAFERAFKEGLEKDKPS